MERFDHDDDGYLAWVSRHPDGFVVNSRPVPSLDEFVLHRATCGSIRELQADKDHWTHQYVKLCAEEMGELLAWSYTQLSGPPTSCTLCDPRPPVRGR